MSTHDASEAAGRPSQLQHDLGLIVGGDFSPDSLGPERHRQIVARVRAKPAEYLRAFEAAFLSTRIGARDKSKLQLPAFLKLIADVAPREVKAAASRLLGQFNTAMTVSDDLAEHDIPLEALPEQTTRLMQRMDMRRRELRKLVG